LNLAVGQRCAFISLRAHRITQSGERQGFSDEIDDYVGRIGAEYASRSFVDEK